MLYEQIEAQLTELLGAPDSLVLPTITHIHTSVIPILAGSGTILLDGRAHKTIYDGCQIARSHGATIRRFAFEDPDDLERLLRDGCAEPRIICMDGVNSMTGNAPDLPAFARVAREYDALLYVDDAHGFGVIGERGDDELCPYGKRGNSLVRHAGETYENLILVGGFSKAYSSLLAFIACPTQVKNMLKVAAPPYLYSGPSPVASLATVLSGLDVNARRGDELRHQIHRKTARVLDLLWSRDVATPNRSGLPVIEIPLARHDDIGEVGRLLFDSGIYVTLAAYPLVPRNEVGFRIQVTAAEQRRRDRPPARGAGRADHPRQAADERPGRGARGVMVSSDGTLRLAGRGIPIWYLYLAFGGIVHAALHQGAAVRRQRLDDAGAEHVLGDRDRRRRAHLPAAGVHRLAADGARAVPVRLRRHLHLQRAERRLPVDRRRDLPGGLPGAVRRRRHADPAAQPAHGAGDADRRADPDGRRWA